MTCHYLCPYGPRTLEHQACQSCDNAIDNLDSTRLIRGMLASIGCDLYEDEEDLYYASL